MWIKGMIAALTVWTCAPVVVEAVPPALSYKEVKALAEPPLHEHPTLLKMLDKNNELREQFGRKPNRMSPELTKAAQNHAEFMARTGSFSHYTNEGYIRRARNAGYRGSVRENIAMGYRTIESTFRGWKNSPGHWSALISSSSVDVGFGYAISKNGTPYWVAVYGTPSTRK